MQLVLINMDMDGTRVFGEPDDAGDVGYAFECEHELGSMEWWRALVKHEDAKYGSMLFEGDEDYRQDGVMFAPTADEMMCMFEQSMGVINSYSRVEQVTVLNTLATDEPGVDVINSAEVAVDVGNVATVTARDVNDTVARGIVDAGASVPMLAAYMAENPMVTALITPPVVNITPAVSNAVAVLTQYVVTAPVGSFGCEDTGYVAAASALADNCDVSTVECGQFARCVQSVHGLHELHADYLAQLLAASPTVRDMFCRFAALGKHPGMSHDGLRIMCDLASVFRRDTLVSSRALDRVVAAQWAERADAGDIDVDQMGMPYMRYRAMSKLFRTYAANGLGVVTSVKASDDIVGRIGAAVIVLAERGITHDVLSLLGLMLCHECGFVVKRTGHEVRCDPWRPTTATIRGLAWLGDALHKLDMRVYADHANVPQKEQETRLLTFTTNAAQATYIRNYYSNMAAAGRSDHYHGSLFESMYSGSFRARYLQRTLGANDAKAVMEAVRAMTMTVDDEAFEQALVKL